MSDATDFQAIEIDAVDEALSVTARRKRMPSLKVEAETAAVPPERVGKKPRQRRRRPLSLEVPEYLAMELKVAAATQSVTVRHLVLTALAETGYRVEPEDLEEDGRRLR